MKIICVTCKASEITNNFKDHWVNGWDYISSKKEVIYCTCDKCPQLNEIQKNNFVIPLDDNEPMIYSSSDD